MAESLASGAQDLVPPLATASPRLRFHLGQVADNQSVISPILPNIPGDPSPYFIQQWVQSSYIQPTLLLRNHKVTYDAIMGKAAYAFEAPDGHAHVWVYRYNGTYVYELYEAGGSLTPGGGSNLFLTSDKFVQDATLDRPITFEFDAKISRASISAPASAQNSGIVLSDAFVGFGLNFVDPTTGAHSVFMQVPIAASRPADVPRKAAFYCQGSNVFLFSPSLVSGEPTLPFAPDFGPLHHFKYSINGYLNDLINSTTCGALPAAAKDPKNWQLTGFYMGLETQSMDARSTTAPPVALGQVEMGLQIANIKATRR
jgi:hypothetical protein